MKIVNRKEFLEMPAGTVYCKIPEEWNFENIEIKHTSCKCNTGNYIDWFKYDLNDIDAGLNFPDYLDEMKEKKVSYAIRFGIGRDGYFEDEDHFLVYEKEDVIKLIEILTKSLDGEKSFLEWSVYES